MCSADKVVLHAPPLTLCRSVHAHVILWLHADDCEAAFKNVVACMPAAWDKLANGGEGDWVRPTDPLHARLFDIVKRKQPHRCTPVGMDGCRQKGPTCTGDFPHKEQLNLAPQLDPEKGRYSYYCPGDEHRNIGPYCPVRRGYLPCNHQVRLPLPC